MEEASPSPALPTRSSYQLDDDEGPQTLGELKQALAPWPQLVADLVADVDAAPFRKLKDVIAPHRVIWQTMVHPAIRKDVEDSEDAPNSDGVPADVVFAEYDPRTFERLDGSDRT